MRKQFALNGSTLSHNSVFKEQTLFDKWSEIELR